MADMMTPEEIKQFVENQKQLYEAGSISATQFKEAINDAKHGVQGYSAGMKDAKGIVGKAALGLAESFADGAKGAEAFNGAIDSAITALGILMTVINPIGAAFAALGIAALTYTKKVNQQSDALYKANQDLAKAGAVGAGGMREIFDNMQKLGYGIEELTQMSATIKMFSGELATFGGTAFDGTKRFVEVSNNLKPLQAQFMNMGYSIDEINQGIGGYIALQTRSGLIQKQTAAEISKGSAEYLRNLSDLSKLTGESAAELQKKQDQAAAIDAFQASLSDMAPEVAKNMQLKFDYISSKFGDQYAATWAKMTTGLGVGTDEAMKAMQVFGPAFYETANNVNQPMKQMALQLHGDLQARQEYNKIQAKLGENTGVFYKTLQFASQSGEDLGKSFDKAAEATDKTAAGADPALAAATGLRQEQMAVRNTMQSMINEGIVPVTKGLKGLTGVLDSITNPSNLGSKLDNLGKPGPATPQSSLIPSGSSLTTPSGGDRSALLNLIGKGESGGDYNKLVGGKTADLTNMTIAEVQALQKTMTKANGFASSAVGKYQMISATLAEQAKKAGLDPSKAKFDQKTQDLLANQLIDQAGYGKASVDVVMKKLAGTWASLPMDMSGRGAYDGFNTNKAGIKPEDLVAAITAPKSGLQRTDIAVAQEKIKDDKVQKQQNTQSAEINARDSQQMNQLLMGLNDTMRQMLSPLQNMDGSLHTIKQSV